jgi:hypothetical protein
MIYKPQPKMDLKIILHQFKCDLVVGDLFGFERNVSIKHSRKVFVTVALIGANQRFFFNVVFFATSMVSVALCEVKTFILA